MISSCSKTAIIMTYLRYKLTSRNVLYFLLNLFFCTGKRVPSKLVGGPSKDTLKVSSVLAPRECYEPKNKRKRNELEKKRVSHGLVELQ